MKLSSCLTSLSCFGNKSPPSPVPPAKVSTKEKAKTKVKSPKPAVITQSAVAAAGQMSNSRNTVTLNVNNIIPFQLPVGNLEPFEVRPIYALPSIPVIKNKKALRAILRVHKRRGLKEVVGVGKFSGDASGGDSDDRVGGGLGVEGGVDDRGEADGEDSSFNNGDESQNDRGVNRGRGRGGTGGVDTRDSEAYARIGEIMIRDVVDEILRMKGVGLDVETKENLKQTFTSDNQAHYLAVSYRMEQHIQHYGTWGTMTTRDMAEVFRGYIGALSAENEMGQKLLWRWLHKLFDRVVVGEVEYLMWLRGKGLDSAELGGGVYKGKENEKINGRADREEETMNEKVG